MRFALSPRLLLPLALPAAVLGLAGCVDVHNPGNPPPPSSTTLVTPAPAPTTTYVTPAPVAPNSTTIVTPGYRP